MKSKNPRDKTEDLYSAELEEIERHVGQRLNLFDQVLLRTFLLGRTEIDSRRIKEYLTGRGYDVTLVCEEMFVENIEKNKEPYHWEPSHEYLIIKKSKGKH